MRRRTRKSERGRNRKPAKPETNRTNDNRLAAVLPLEVISPFPIIIDHTRARIIFPETFPIPVALNSIVPRDSRRGVITPHPAENSSPTLPAVCRYDEASAVAFAACLVSSKRTTM